MLKTVRTADGDLVLVNPAHIKKVVDLGGYRVVYLVGEDMLQLKDTFHRLQNILG